MCCHFCYLPLIPHGSMIVTGKDGDAYQGVQIPLSLKSWAVGWVQVSLTGLMVLLGMMLVGLLIASCDDDLKTRKQIDLGRDRVMLKWVAGIEAALAGLMLATTVIPGVGRASAARAKEPAQILAAAQAYGRYVFDRGQRDGRNWK